MYLKKSKLKTYPICNHWKLLWESIIAKEWAKNLGGAPMQKLFEVKFLQKKGLHFFNCENHF